jgi:hypothetical protein
LDRQRRSAFWGCCWTHGWPVTGAKYLEIQPSSCLLAKCFMAILSVCLGWAFFCK